MRTHTIREVPSLFLEFFFLNINNLRLLRLVLTEFGVLNLSDLY
jgi:hypothetical protein